MYGLNVPALAPLRGAGDFFATALEIVAALFKWPFAWGEFIRQGWFVTRVSAVPAITLTISFNALVVFALNVILIELGAADLSGVGAALSVMTQVGPFCTALVCSGAAVCVFLFL